MISLQANERDRDDEEVWSWGAGTEGQLGTGKLQDEHLPQLLPFQSSFTFLSCGGAHVIAITPGKKVLTWGRGTSGQLGHGDLVNSFRPKLVEFLSSCNITHVSAGWNHSGFVSETGSLFTCGDGLFGQLGHGDNRSQRCPIKVSSFEFRHVEQIACGMRHSLAYLKGESGDQVYAFGSGKRGQLGISQEKVKCINLPQNTSGLEFVDIKSITANGDHSAALSVDGNLYTWGRGFNGTSDMCCPNRVVSPFAFTQAALGWNHALLLTDEGEVLMLGGSHHGALSNPCKTNFVNQELKEVLMEKIPSLDGITIAGIASGAEHSAIASESGIVMTWGWGEHGQLGLGHTGDETSPQVVSLSLGTQQMTSEVYCGSGFTIAVRKRRHLC